MNSQDLNQEFLTLKDSAYRYAASLLRAPTEAEDVTQDLYERLWRRRLLIRRTGFRALVMTTVASTWDFSKHRSAFSIRQPTSFSPLQ